MDFPRLRCAPCHPHSLDRPWNPRSGYLWPSAHVATHLPASAVAQRWIVTDGPRLIQLRDQSGPLPGITPPQIEEISATGSGDVFLACMLHAWCNRGYDLSAAVKFALPYAAANAAHPGIAEFPEPALPTSHNFTK
ncbi:MAG: hypothetical protein EBU32_12170 [Opitutaceae bacterium]|nr:hypothetical protein [Opitutaceae bacterium]